MHTQLTTDKWSLPTYPIAPVIDMATREDPQK
jgi:hypothetical protein